MRQALAKSEFVCSFYVLMIESGQNGEEARRAQACLGADQLADPATCDPVGIVQAVLDRPVGELDYAQAKLAFDRLIDASVDAETVLAELDRMAAVVSELVGPVANDGVKLSAVRKLIYDSGPWNGGRPFAYDMSDPLGRRMENKLLHNYLANRLGQCVSMPALFLILTDRLGLNVALVQSPEHLFVRYTAPDGRFMNIETTNGGHPTRDEWYRQTSPITDLAVENGLYLRPLCKREGVAALASIVVEHLWDLDRFEEMISISKIVLDHFARDVPMLLWQGGAYGKLLDQLQQEHPIPFVDPPAVRRERLMLVERNRSLFAAAERLGWVPWERPDGPGTTLT